MSITLSSSDPFVLGIFEEFAKINHLPATIAVLDNTVVELVQDPDVYKSIQDEVAQLAKTLCDLENGFATVERHLHRIDNKKAVEIDGKPRVYAPEWRTLHDEFTQLMHLSQSTANEVKSRISDLTLRVIPSLQNPDYTPGKKKEELERYIADLIHFQGNGSRVEERYCHLGKQVTDFRNNLKADVADQNPSDSLTEVPQRIATIDSEIKRLQAELKRIGGFSGGCCNVIKLAGPVAAATTSTLVATGGTILGLVAGIAALAPVVAGCLLAAIAIALGYAVTQGVINHNAEKTEKQNSLQEYEAERIRLTIGQKNLLEILHQLNILNTTFDDITGRLSSIQYIWHILVMDSQNLQKALEELPLSSTNDDAFQQRLSSVKTLYHTLLFALDEYTLQVSKARVSKQTSA